MNLRGPVVIACAAPYGIGGLGRHLQELDEYCRARDLQTRLFSASSIPRWASLTNRWTPLRFSPAWQAYAESIIFDRFVARNLGKAKTLIGFNGQCLHSMRRARAMKFDRIVMAAATPHVNHTSAQLRKAFAYAPVEPMRFIRAQQRRYAAESIEADTILYATNYIRDSFVREGFAANKLQRFDLSPHPRFQPAPQRATNSSLRAVYVGSLNMIKGIAVLLDAFALLPDADAQLTLVGGSGTRSMRRYLAERCARDPRVRVAPGDPLPWLQAADVCVHAAFQDGCAYAPMEALACGLPVIVTDETGMKEFVRDGENGFIVPAGDPAAMAHALGKVRALPRAS